MNDLNEDVPFVNGKYIRTDSNDQWAEVAFYKLEEYNINCDMS